MILVSAAGVTEVTLVALPPLGPARRSAAAKASLTMITFCLYKTLDTTLLLLFLGVIHCSVDTEA